jgi:hypothetical protein
MGYRKLAASIVGTIAASALCYVGKIDGSQFVTALGITVGGFLAINYASRKASP